MIINVTYPPKDKFEHIAVSLTHKEAQILTCIRSRAVYNNVGTSRVWDISLTEGELSALHNITEPIREKL